MLNETSDTITSKVKASLARGRTSKSNAASASTKASTVQ